MTNEEFNKYAKQFDEHCKSIIANRTDHYQTNEDALYNFDVGASIIGLTPTQTCWAYMTKHIAALKKMVTNMDISDMDDWLEKCGDLANYSKLLYICASDMRNAYDAQKSATSVDAK